MSEKTDLAKASSEIGDRLLEGIKSRIRQANTITAREFVAQFGGLSDPNLPHDTRVALSAAYRERFGLYEGVDIVDDHGEVLVHRPALVGRIKSLDGAGVADPDAVHKLLLNDRDDPDIAILKNDALKALAKKAVQPDNSSIMESSDKVPDTTTPSEDFMDGFED